MNLYQYFSPLFAIWVKFCTRELDIMIVSFCEFRENRRRQGCT